MNVPQGSVRPGSVRPGSVRLGFLGAGLIARYHAGSLRAAGCLGSGGSGPAPGGAPAAVLTGVFDPDGERAEQFAHAHGTIVRRSEEEVIEHCDAVYVCTWTAEHRRQVELAAAAGRAVFCEKPLAPTLADARAMAAAVQRAGVVHQVGLVLRSVPGFALLRALLREPAAGRLSTVVFRDDQELPVGGYYGSTWRADRTKAGAGTLLEHSIHDLDLLEWLCGPVRTLSAHQDNLHGHDGIEDTVSVSFRFAGGGTGVLSSTWHDVPGRVSNRRFELFSERGRFEAEGNAAEAVRWEHRAGELHEVLGADQQRRRAAELGVVLPGNADAAFVEAVAGGGRADPDFSVVLRAHELVDAVYRSAAAGGAPVEV
ncbi:MAG: Gfo/Idh/MocA family protein [Acidimicrobiia bacterium]